MRGQEKIHQGHLERKAYVYVRQSSPGQVARHKEGGRRQRELVKLAEALGWPRSRIELLDADNAKTATTSADRDSFKKIVGDVSVGEVGLVLGLEVARLARNAADWFPLVEMCALTDTLIGDEDGIYDGNDYNDIVVLGFKGTFSEAEARAIKARLQGARWSLARRGELRRKLCAGYVRDEKMRSIKDPDERVRSALDLFFARYRELGSGCAVARSFNEEGLLFPHRDFRGPWDGPVKWRPLTVRTANRILRTPFYAGVYSYGARRAKTILDPQTKARKTVMKKLPMDEWEVLIHNAHPGYIPWEEFVSNRKRQSENRFGGSSGGPGAPRSGKALLQSLVFCSNCGKRLALAYSCRGKYPTYVCKRMLDSGKSVYCQAVPAARIDCWVEAQVLEAISPAGIEAAEAAVEELEQRSAAVRRQWEQQIEHAEYEANLARKRYEAVDPENRLVASNLERDWEERLREVEALKKEFAERSQRPPIHISEEDLKEVRSLARDIPRLWRAKTTKQEDRKRVIRILIREVWVLQEDEPWQTRVRIHWKTGAVTEGTLERPLPIAQRWKTPVEVVERIRQLHAQNRSRPWIAEQLNREGLRTGQGLEFTSGRVAGILDRWNIYGADGKKANKFRTPDKVVERLKELHAQGKKPREIAEAANREGLRTGRGNAFNALRVKTLLWDRHITGSQLDQER
jgi:DNA invertase Pin-like site-specific DNA recombinase